MRQRDWGSIKVGWIVRQMFEDGTGDVIMQVTGENSHAAQWATVVLLSMPNTDGTTTWLTGDDLFIAKYECPELTVISKGTK